MSKAKTALKSKNNPNARGAVKKFKYQGKEIIPVKLVPISGKKQMCAQYEDGTLVLNDEGNPIAWAVASSSGR
ncbi:MAG: hypothetical protein K9G11_03265 [Rickettsiaceae bacterium]|nr:hypothetical protein [Rickettsiaceae bacterium]